MIVTKSTFAEVLGKLKQEGVLSLDTETLGLRTYHGDHLFSIIISTRSEAYYFNFNKTPDFTEGETLTRTDIYEMQDQLFSDSDKYWFIHNAANFDLGVLGVDGCEINGTVHCTKAIARVEYNEHMKYSLSNCLERIGDKKDDAVANYIKEHKLYDTIQVPGKLQKQQLQHYDKVPRSLIVPYAEQDALGTFHLGEWQLNSILEQDILEPKLNKAQSLDQVMAQENRLVKTIYRMRHQGVLIDRDYCQRASAYEKDRVLKARQTFRALTGFDYADSPKVFAQVFKDQKELWSYTEKNNPSFDADALQAFSGPVAESILEIRNAKSRQDFFNGFLFHADKYDRVHPSFNQDGTRHGRLSSSEPNFQNLTSEEDSEEKREFSVRGAIVAPEGFTLTSIDYDAMEYRFAFEMSARLAQYKTPLIDLILSGLDPHEATAKLAGTAGVVVSRKNAKIVNFLTLYGGGIEKLAKGLKCTEDQARVIRNAIFKGAPEIGAYIAEVVRVARTRGYIINWLGRRCHFPDPRFAYKAPNYHVSGGCADVVKRAMNQMDDLLICCRSKMTMTIHDECVFEIHDSEPEIPEKLRKIMENAFQSKYLPLTCSVSSGAKNLGEV